VTTWFAEYADFGQWISAACNSVSIEIKLCCEAQQINQIKTTGNVDGAERKRTDRNTRGAVTLIRKTCQLTSDKILYNVD
jgi:hypothetical protein